MLDSYNKFNHNISINSCSGGIYKTYKESWFKRLHLKSDLMEALSNHENVRYYDNNYIASNYYSNYERAKPIVVLQMVICGEMEVIAEIMYKEDFDKYFDDLKEEE